MSRFLFLFALSGAFVLGVINSFSMSNSVVIRKLIEFWPVWISIQYFYILIQDMVYHRVIHSEYFSPFRKLVFYFGLGLSLAICTFDHVPEIGLFVPAIGNLLLTFYLFFISQLLVPQKILRMESLVSRFFAVLTLSLMITGFFALLYSYISESFSLFLLNSFLISFLVLSLWSPLVTLFRFLTLRFVSRSDEIERRRVERLLLKLSTVTHFDELESTVQSYFKSVMDAVDVKLIYDQNGIFFPEGVNFYLEKIKRKNQVTLLHRGILEIEKDQQLSSERKSELDLVLRFLMAKKADVFIPLEYQKKIIGAVVITAETHFEETSLAMTGVEQLLSTTQEIAHALVRLGQIQKDKDQERLLVLGEMSAGLAHEIRNPLGAIQGAVSLMDQTANPWTKMIHEEVGRLNRLVTQFLDFSTNAKGMAETVELNSALQKSIRFMQDGMPQVSLELIPHAPLVKVQIVPDHFQQIVSNLIQNALKAVEGRPNQKILIRVEKNGFSVTDHGVGMSTEILAKAFQPFFSSFKKGSGLGLAICERLVVMNGGRIKIQSIENQGTTVSVELPHA